MFSRSFSFLAVLLLCAMGGAQVVGALSTEVSAKVDSAGPPPEDAAITRVLNRLTYGPRLAIRFIGDAPSPQLIDRLAARFTATQGDLREVMKAVLASPEFLSPEAYRAKVKTPLEFVVSACVRPAPRCKPLRHWRARCVTWGCHFTSVSRRPVTRKPRPPGCRPAHWSAG